jgi:hypothetical protein
MPITRQYIPAESHAQNTDGIMFTLPAGRATVRQELDGCLILVGHLGPFRILNGEFARLRAEDKIVDVSPTDD